MFPNRFTSADDSSRRSPPPYSRLPFSITPPACTSRSPAVPTKPRLTILPVARRLSGPPPWILPLSVWLIAAADSVLLPPPATMRPCCVSVPVLVTVTPLPCSVPACTRSPVTASVSWPPAASVRVKVNGVPMSARRSPSAANCPSCVSCPARSCSPPALYSRAPSPLVRLAACTASRVSPSSVPRLSSAPSVVMSNCPACTVPRLVHCGRCSVSPLCACSVPRLSSCAVVSVRSCPCTQPALVSCVAPSASCPPDSSCPPPWLSSRVPPCTVSPLRPCICPALLTDAALSDVAPPSSVAPARFSSCSSSVAVS